MTVNSGASYETLEIEKGGLSRESLLVFLIVD